MPRARLLRCTAHPARSLLVAVTEHRTRAVFLYALDDVFGGPFTEPTYDSLLEAVSGTLGAFVSWLDSEARNAADVRDAAAILPVLEAVASRATNVAQALAGGGMCGGRVASREAPEDRFAAERGRREAAAARLGAYVEDPTTTERTLGHAAAQAAGCPASLAASLLKHPACTLEVLARLALADRVTGTAIPAVLRVSPLTVADAFAAAGGVPRLIAQMAPDWRGTPTDLATAAAGIASSPA